MLAAHVVGARQDVAERRPAKHQVRAAGPGDAERQVRMAAGDHVESERSGGAVDVRFQPRRHRLDVDSRYVAHVLTRPVMCDPRVVTTPLPIAIMHDR